MGKEKVDIKSTLKETAEKVGKGVTAGAAAAADTAKKVADKSKETLDASQKAVINVIDQDGNGQIDSRILF